MEQSKTSSQEMHVLVTCVLFSYKLISLLCLPPWKIQLTWISVKIQCIWGKKIILSHLKSLFNEKEKRKGRISLCLLLLEVMCRDPSESVEQFTFLEHQRKAGMVIQISCAPQCHGHGKGTYAYTYIHPATSKWTSAVHAFCFTTIACFESLRMWQRWVSARIAV